MATLDPMREELLKTDDNFRNLYEEHQEYKEKLQAIRSKSLPDEDDENEMKRIKLHKLSLKDQMEEIVRSHQEKAVTA